MEFCINIAEKKIRIRSLFDQVFHMCREYLTEDEASADLEVSISEEDILFERERTGREEAQAKVNYSDAYLETLAVYRKIATELLESDTFLMHGSVIGLGDKAVMLTATSGTGKTTLTRYLLNKNEDCFVVNGDKPLISAKDGEKTYAYGTPWSGKENMNTNCKSELSAIIILARTEELSLQKLDFGQAFSTLLQQTYRPADASGMKKTLELLERMSRNVSFYRLGLPYYEHVRDILEDEELGLIWGRCF